LHGQTYWMDRRERVVGAVETRGLSRRQAAAQVDGAISTVTNWVSQFRATGSVKAGQMGGPRPKTISGRYRAWRRRRCREPDFPLRGLVSELAAQGLKVDCRSVWEFVHAEKLSYKKAAGRHRAGPARYSASAGARDQTSDRHRSWPQGGHRRDLNQDHHGTAARLGPAWPAALRQGAFRSLDPPTFIGALRSDRLEAPWRLNGPINGARFWLYVETVLVPTRRPGDIVVLDHLGSHKGKAVRRAIRAAGAKVFSGPNTRPIGTPSSRSLLSSSIGAATRKRDQPMPSATPWAQSFKPQPHRHAPTTSSTLDTPNLTSSRAKASGDSS
jgi:transposase